jgi:hypothetical protein
MAPQPPNLGGRSILGLLSAYECQFYERPTAYKVPQYTLRVGRQLMEHMLEQK